MSRNPNSTNEIGKENLRPGAAGTQLCDDFESSGESTGSDECAYAAWLQRCEEARLRMERRTAGDQASKQPART